VSFSEGKVMLMPRFESRWTKLILRRWTSRPHSRRGSPLHLEPLEARSVPAIITPTTFADGGPGSGSLRDAVLQFNADTGTDDDIIQLLPGTYSLTIRNVGNRHETAGLTGDLNLTQTSHRWIIQGAGASTIIDASQLQDRVFQIVNPGTQVVFQDIVIQGGLAQDDGADGALAGFTDALGGGILNNGGNVTLDNVVVQNSAARGADAAAPSAPGHNASGGALYSTGGALTLAGATIANNQAIGGHGGDSYSGIGGDGGSGAGGGLYATVGSLDISNSTIASNQATGGGAGMCGTQIGTGDNGGPGQGAGLYVTGSSLSIATSTIASNQAMGGPSCGTGAAGAGQGGGLYNAGTLTVTGSSTLSDNSATANTNQPNVRVVFGGGGIYNTGTLTVSNSTLSGNSTTYVYFYFAALGGGICNLGTLTVSNSTLSGNSGYNGAFGGGIGNSGTLTVSDSTLSGNTGYQGGGIYNYGTLTVSNSTLSGNTGAGISNSWMLTVSNSTLSGNTGAGISNSWMLMVSNSTLSGNTASGIFNFYGTVTVSHSTLSGNSAFGNGGGGGGISNSNGTLTVTGSTLSGNSASDGGGIANEGTLTVTNSTLTGNSATSRGYGGGIFTYGLHRVTLTNVTLTANRATNGGGLYVDHRSPVLHNTLIAGNFRGLTGRTRDDAFGALDPSGNYNLIGDGTNMIGLSNGVNGNLIGNASDPIDPLLDSLGDYGGSTKTHALLAGSPALNAGDPHQLGTTDQRGVVRSGSVNIGAFQASATALLISAPDTVQSGTPFDVTVTAVDPFGQVAVGYLGTVTFNTSDPDPGVVLPADFSFTANDGGVHTFTDSGLGEITLVTPGDQTLTVTDTTDDTINGHATITVMGGNVPWTQDRFCWTDLAPSLLSADRRR
jgi:hypothetical protein